MNLVKLLKEIKNNVGDVTIKKLHINISVDVNRLNNSGILFLYRLLNQYDNLYFITIKNLPYCLMPDALEHLLCLKNKNEKVFYDKKCKDCDFRKTCPGWKNFKKLSLNTQRKTKQIPKETVIEITRKCNLNCTLCTTEKNNNSDISLTKIKSIINDSKQMGIDAIRFTGGEPTLHKEIKRFILEAKKNNFYVILNTNATTIDKKLIDFFGKTVDNLLISLQGYNQISEQKHINTKINWKKKISNILLLKSRVKTVRIGTIISKTLVENIEKYARLIKKMGVTNWELYRPITYKKDTNFQLSKKDILGVMKYLFNLKKQGMKVKIANPIPFCISKNMDFSSSVLLGAVADDGYSRLVWDVQGYFKPSYFIDKNLGKKTKKAWQSNFLKKIKSLEYLPPQCKKCDYLKWCRGGSRAIAKINNNSYFSPDPLMSLKKL
ncbi:MAG: radical SAM protein [Candidatus Omnitrophica bacterium]|nr:radical SAM protein [Candidatus Omnitrophota bacterium]